jgi:hypothetical protein
MTSVLTLPRRTRKGRVQYEVEPGRWVSRARAHTILNGCPLCRYRVKAEDKDTCNVCASKPRDRRVHGN